MRPLHRLNPVRLAYIKEQVAGHFGRDTKPARALDGLRILDIGCGAGLVSEPLSRMGAEVTGIDPSPEIVAAARLHAEEGGLAIDYRATTAEALAAKGETFDAVTILEVVEHVTDVDAFVATVASLVRPGGIVVASTINRTLKAFALAIVGAEYLLRWLPRGTHSYDRLVTPAELSAAFRAAGLVPGNETGVMYVPIADRWRLTSDTDVNYMMTAVKG
jgi:2-polyprenyl-6-hydroxyphenyl methylase/3-demethylubiquinone-9 3-methyltransferase